MPYRLIAQTMSTSGREFYPPTRSEHLDVLACRPYTSQPNIGNILASRISGWNLLERSALRPLSMSSVATLIFPQSSAMLLQRRPSASAGRWPFPVPDPFR